MAKFQKFLKTFIVIMFAVIAPLIYLKSHAIGTANVKVHRISIGSFYNTPLNLVQFITQNVYGVTKPSALLTNLNSTVLQFSTDTTSSNPSQITLEYQGTDGNGCSFTITSTNSSRGATDKVDITATGLAVQGRCNAFPAKITSSGTDSVAIALVIKPIQ